MSTEIMLLTILVGLVAGYLAGVLVHGRGFGIVVDILVGILGAWIGPRILVLLNI